MKSTTTHYFGVSTIMSMKLCHPALYTTFGVECRTCGARTAAYPARPMAMADWEELVAQCTNRSGHALSVQIAPPVVEEDERQIVDLEPVSLEPKI